MSRAISTDMARPPIERVQTLRLPDTGGDPLGFGSDPYLILAAADAALSRSTTSHDLSALQEWATIVDQLCSMERPVEGLERHVDVVIALRRRELGNSTILGQCFERISVSRFGRTREGKSDRPSQPGMSSSTVAAILPLLQRAIPGRAKL
jgi:hypothetical protein